MPGELRSQIIACLREHQAALAVAECELTELEKAYRSDSERIKADIDTLRNTYPERFREEAGRRPSHPELMRYERELEMRAASMRTVTQGQLSQARDKVNRHGLAFKTQMELWTSLFPGQDYQQAPPTLVPGGPLHAAPTRHSAPDPQREDHIQPVCQLQDEAAANVRQRILGPLPPPPQPAAEPLPPSPWSTAPLVDEAGTAEDRTLSYQGRQAPVAAGKPPRPVVLKSRPGRPFGYYAGEDRVIQKILEFRRHGHSTAWIAELLNADLIRNLPPLAGGRWWDCAIDSVIARYANFDDLAVAPVAGSIPYGWRRNQRGQLEESVPEQVVIQRAKTWRKEGVGPVEIASRLNLLGYKTKQGKAWNGDRVRHSLLRPDDYVPRVGPRTCRPRAPRTRPRIKPERTVLPGPVPFGWRKDQHGQITTDEREQFLIREIKRLSGSGMTAREIAAYLQAEHGGGNRHTRPGSLNRNSVLAILKRPDGYTPAVKHFQATGLRLAAKRPGTGPADRQVP